MSKQNQAGGMFTLATRLLRKTTLDADEANQLIEILEEMTSIEAAKIIERVESKFDVQAEQLNSINSKYNVMIWVFGVAFAVLSLVIAITSL